MNLTLQLNLIPKRFKTKYSFDDTVVANVRFRRSGSVASVMIKSEVFNCFHEDFKVFEFMAKEAKKQLDSENRLDEDCLVAIDALGLAL